MKMLFITQKLHGQDAFGVFWIEAFRRRGYEVEALCLEWRPDEVRHVLGREGGVEFIVHSMGKEKGYGKIRQTAMFLRLISGLQYDRVFIHMTPVWGLIGAPVWLLRRMPVYLWYTHYKMQAGLRALHLYARRLFCATPQSMPQYSSTGSGQADAKKVVVGHGIDLLFWPKRENRCGEGKRLLVVHRLARSKRLELAIKALLFLPGYRLDVYGMEAEPEYVGELKDLVGKLKLADRIVFHGTVPVRDLPEIYTRYRFILNFASETIDKTMLEAMTCGCYPVTTRQNAEAIGLRSAIERSYGRQVGILAAPAEDTPESIAAFVRDYEEHPLLDPESMYWVVKERHGLDALVEKMDAFIRKGI